MLIAFFIGLSPSAAFAQQYWGALAIDKNTGIAGASWDADSRAQAESTALSFCRKKHKGKNNCKILTSFYNGCAAVYWSPINKRGGFATSDYNAEQA